MKLNNCNHLLTFLAWGQSCFDEKTNSISFLLLQYRKERFCQSSKKTNFRVNFFHTKSREIVGHFISIRRSAFWNGNRNISFKLLHYREERFRQTSESTNSRVLWWSLGQTCILLVMGAWQMRHLKSFFEAKKLV